MFTVGLDVDTLVSFNVVTCLSTIWPFAGSFGRRASPLGANNNAPIGKALCFFSRRHSGDPNDQQVILSSSTLATPSSPNQVIDFDFDGHLLSDPLQKHRKLETEEKFGGYLASLIESAGYLGPRMIEITFHLNGTSSAYYIKSRPGHGNVYFPKREQYAKYAVYKLVGLEQVKILLTTKSWAIKNCSAGSGRIRGAF